ncbi:glycosyltransferase [Polynucleobacter acidiphobus]|uniref:glycosyltransferase n=1 Tax=Polynucleobacter acidiphobus TaxID=556053 RepID=UPI001F42AD0E|nr:glycosyltransferase [Polynucleobacter acidiphobus]
MSKNPSSSGYQNWLILSHGFNMDGRAASQTITDKIPYLMDAGIQLSVLSAITGSKDRRFFHQQLIAWGPAAFRFDFRHWFANRFGRGVLYKIITPLISIVLSPLILLEKLVWGYSSQWSWAFPAYLAGLRLIRQGKVNLIYSTGGAWSAHLAGLWLKKKTNLPWIVEVHDPLVIRLDETDQGMEIPKEPDAKKRYWLEQQICQHADLVWWFTEGALHYAKKRNPNLGNQSYAKGVMIIPGANPPDVDTVIAQTMHHYGSHLNIAHFGSLADDRSLTQVLAVLPQFFTEYPQARDQIRLHIYGAQLDRKSKEWLNQSPYQDNVIEHGRLEFDPSTGLTGRQRIAIQMQQSDILLLLHGSTEWCREYIPSKLYDYFWTSRPIWGLVYENLQLDTLLSRRESYVSDAKNPEAILNSLKKIYSDWIAKTLPEPSIPAISVEEAVEKILSEVRNSK